MDVKGERWVRTHLGGLTRLIFGALLFIAGMSLIGLSSGCKYCYKGKAFDAEALYAKLPLGSWTQPEMIRYIIDHGGVSIDSDENEGLFRMRYEDNYLVLVQDTDQIVRAIAVYSEEGSPVYLDGVKPIAFDENRLPTTCDEVFSAYGAPHGERGSGLWLLCYLTEDAEIVAFRVGNGRHAVTGGETGGSTPSPVEPAAVLSVYTEPVSTMAIDRNYILQPIN